MSKWAKYILIVWLVVLAFSVMQKDFFSWYVDVPWINLIRIGLYVLLCIITIWYLFKEQLDKTLFWLILVVFISSGINNFVSANFQNQILDSGYLIARMFRSVWYLLPPIWVLWKKDEFDDDINWFVIPLIFLFTASFGFSLLKYWGLF